MADTKVHSITQWDTFHNNGPFPAKTLFETSLAGKAVMPDRIDRYKDAAMEIQRLLKESADHHERFRAFGSAWSLSNIAHQKDRMHFNAAMNIKMTIEAGQVHASSPLKSENLFFFQCGNTIKEISEFLLRNGRSLKASGASNGQTIAGAISTGIHGAALDAGSVQDSVAGINLITGPNPEDNVYIERHTQPALSDAFAASINARVIRNDGLFHAALVSLGAFGFIHGVLMDTENAYLLKRYTRKITRAQTLEIAESLNFADASFRIPEETDANGKGLRPYHFKVYINPYNPNEDYVTEICYKKPYRSGYPNPIPRIKTAIYKDMPTWIAQFASRHNRLIPRMINALRGQIFPALDTDMEGTLGEIFWDSTHKGPAFAWAFGVDHKDTRKALDLFIKLVNEEGPVPGAMAIRFVKASPATLAFTRFPVTCIVEMDGILWKSNSGMISQEEMERRFIEVFKANDLEFTIHWGKNAAWSFPGLADYMYGDKDDEWKEYRSALLTRKMADIFSNDFLDAIKLSDYRVHTDVALAENKPVTV